MPVDERLIHKLAWDHVTVRAPLMRTAGEIRHVKDTGPVKRRHIQDHEYSPRDYRLLTKILWQLSVALGHVSSASSDFVRVKSVQISPDGRLGGNGYDRAIKDMRKDLYTAIELISSLQDTIHDELGGPHWHPEQLPKQEQREVEELMEDVRDVEADPDAFGDEAYEEAVDDAVGSDIDVMPDEGDLSDA